MKAIISDINIADTVYKPWMDTKCKTRTSTYV